MLHRAASNAYSWWWASHIRTKQSKWLQQSLQDMEKKVQCMLKLISEDGDSFAKRAEMYYRKRPELISHVEESYRAYRALAERYEHISGELQNANTTIATVFPEHVQFAMDDDDEFSSPKPSRRQMDPTKGFGSPKVPKGLSKVPDIPKMPNFPKKIAKYQSGKKTLPQEEKMKNTKNSTISGKSKNEAGGEIDKLQKGILALQTEKEFVMESYENGLAKFWEIEKKIEEMQDEVCILQDEFNVGSVIEDGEARKVMAATALKSCQETLVQLQDKQERSAEEAKVEYNRIKDAYKKFEHLKGDFPSETHIDTIEPTLQNVEQQDAELIREKIRKHFETSSGIPLSTTELAEKIDELVTKVISLETAVSSQTALINRLRSENDDLQANLLSLEEDKAQGTEDLKNKLQELEHALSEVQDLNQNVKDQNKNLQTHITQAHCNFEHLSEKLQTVRELDDDVESIDSVPVEVVLPLDTIHNEIEERQATEQTVEESNDSIHDEPFKEHEELAKAEESALVAVADFPADHTEIKEDLSRHLHNHENLNEPLEDHFQPIDHSIEEHNIQEHDIDITSEECKEPVQPEEHTADSPPTEHRDDSILQEPSERNKEESLDTKDVDSSIEKLSEEPENPFGSTLDDSSKELKETLEPKDISDHPEAFVEQEVQMKTHDLVKELDLSKTEESIIPNLNSNEEEIFGDEPNWQHLFLKGLENREKILLAEYTSILRNYKETKKKLSDTEKQNRDSLMESMGQVRELKSVNAIKEEEIRSLQQKLNFLQPSSEEIVATDLNLTEFKDDQKDIPYEKPPMSWDANFSFKFSEDKVIIKEVSKSPKVEEEDEEDIKVILPYEPHQVSTIEDKFRTDIDELLEQNLEFWLRFSTSFHQIQNFQTAVQDLKSEYSKLKESKKREDTSEQALRSDARPLYKHLREIQTELNFWLEQNASLKDELKGRLASLGNIQDEILRVSKTGSEDEDVNFTSYQAAKFQGEVLNMQQENNKVADELQAGLDHVQRFQFEVDKTLSKLNEDFKLSGSKNRNHIQDMKHSISRTKIPLRTFIFGNRPRRQKPKMFMCMNPTLQKQYSDMNGGYLDPSLQK